MMSEVSCPCWCHTLADCVATACEFAVIKPYGLEDDMDDRTNLDAFLEKTRVAVANRGVRTAKRRNGGKK